MGIEPIISSLQDWCLTTMALEALNTTAGNRTLVTCLEGKHSTIEPQLLGARETTVIYPSLYNGT